MFNGNMSMPSLADIAAVTGNEKNSGWGDNGAWWIIIFVLFFAFGGWGNGNGWGNNGNGGATPYSTSAVTQADLQRGFDTQAIIGKLDGLNNGLCDGFYAMNTAVMNGTNTIQNAVQQASTTNLQNTYAIQQAINADTVANMQNTNALQAQLAQCCCNTQSGLKDVQYQNATDTCAITNAIQTQTQQIMQNCNDNYRSLHDELVQSQLDAKDAKIAEQASAIQALNLAASQQAQNTWLVNALKPAPIPAFPAANLYGGLYAQNGCTGCNGTGTIGF